jgi:ABC-2 type transport system permease protein
MWSLFLREIRSFFSSLTGYIVVIVFLIANGLFMWVFPGEMNVLDAGYANLDTLFLIAPWVFLFLVPAVTMRTFSEEKKAGTMELLLTRPVSDLQVVLAKYFAAIIVVLLSLLPTFVYFVSVYSLGNPVGNLDLGGIWGSYIGLFFLAAIYAAIGIFVSSLTENQIISFILAVFLSFLLFTGFDFIGSLPIFGHINTIILNLGINEHYKSISRGVLDSRDVFYFLSLIIIFLYSTKTLLQHRK